MATHPEGDNDVAVVVSRKRAATTSDGARPQKQSRKRGGKLHKVLDLPYDVLLEILYQLDPYSLWRLSQASRDIRAFLLNRASRHIWSTVIKNFGMPECPPELSEPHYIRLVFDMLCFECNGHIRQDVNWEAKTRCCQQCSPKVYTYWLPLSLPFEVRDYIPKVMQTTRPRGFRYYQPVVNRYQELYQSIAGNDVLKAEWIAELKAQQERYAPFVDSITKWMLARKEERAQYLAEKKAARRLIIETKLKELGWGPDLISHCFTLNSKDDPRPFHKNVVKDRDISDKVWESIRPDLEACLILQCQKQWTLVNSALMEKGWSEDFVVDCLQNTPLIARHSDPPCKSNMSRWQDVIHVCELYMQERVIARLHSQDGWPETLCRKCNKPDGSIIPLPLPMVNIERPLPREQVLQNACRSHLSALAIVSLRRRSAALLSVIGVMLENSLGFFSLQRGHTISPSVADLVESPPVLSAALAYADSLELPSHPGLNSQDELRFNSSTPWNLLIAPHFGSLWDSWKSDRNSELLTIAQCSRVPFHPDDLSLATTFFRCRSGMHRDEPIAYPRILTHTCLTQPMANSVEREDSLHTRLGHVPWNFHNLVEFDHSACEVARAVVLACGAHPDYMTAKEMSTLNPFLECMACSSTTSNQVFMTWKRAVIHGLTYHDERQPAIWRCLAHNERAALRSFANESEAKHLMAEGTHDSNCFLCKNCRLTGSFQTVYYHLTYQHAEASLVPHPDSGYTPMEIMVPHTSQLATEIGNCSSVSSEEPGYEALSEAPQSQVFQAYMKLIGEQEFVLREWEMSVYPSEELRF